MRDNDTTTEAYQNVMAELTKVGQQQIDTRNLVNKAVLSVAALVYELQDSVALANLAGVRDDLAALKAETASTQAQMVTCKRLLKWMLAVGGAVLFALLLIAYERIMHGGIPWFTILR